jgi:hypothetical protein
LERILVHLLERRRTDVAVPLAPPPTEASKIEPFFPLTQPPLRGEADPQPSAEKEP